MPQDKHTTNKKRLNKSASSLNLYKQNILNDDILKENMRLLNVLKTEKSTLGSLFLQKGKSPKVPSLNMSNRKKEVVRICQENFRMVQRLQEIKGETKKIKRTKS